LEYPDHAALRAFYNAQSVFVVPSHFEGWGLPGIEAIACGSALVTTDNGGCGDYAIDGATALVVPPRTPDAIAEAVSRLFEDDALRRHLVSTGGDFVRRFTWDAAVDALEAAWSLADPPAASHIG
jgi:glycosyltransferase involved in cell wall biosynthesis